MAPCIWCSTISTSSAKPIAKTDPTQADLQTVVANLLAGQYERPLRVVAFNTAQGWARDVTAAIAREVLARAPAGAAELPLAVRDLVEGAA